MRTTWITASFVALAACSADTGLLRDGGVVADDATAASDATSFPDATPFPDASTLPDAAPPDSGSLAEISAAIVSGQCDFYARCLPSYFAEHFSAEDLCEAAGAGGLARELSALIEAGRARLDPAQLAECLAALTSGDCTMSSTWIACRGITIGTQPRGSKCASSDECAPGLRCRGGYDCGTCEDAIPLGGSCDVTALNGCASGFCYTMIAGTPATCVPSLAREGEPCMGLYSECAEPLYCDNSTPGDRRCRTPPAIGDTCPGTPPRPPCNFYVARCTGGMCRALIFVDPGEACDVEHVCRGECIQGMCNAPRGLGEMCTAMVNGDCGSGAGLCGSDGICRARPDEGEECFLSHLCAPGLVCAGSPGRCTARPWDSCP